MFLLMALFRYRLGMIVKRHQYFSRWSRMTARANKRILLEDLNEINLTIAEKAIKESAFRSAIIAQKTELDHKLAAVEELLSSLKK